MTSLGIFQMISNFTLGQSQTATSGLAGAIPGMKSESGQSKEKALGANTGRSESSWDV